MSLDPLIVRILKIYGEILVVAFFAVFFLIDHERDFVTLRMEIYLRMGPFNKLTWNIILSFHISIYTLSDLGDLSNLIGLLSRTIQQYSPPSEWIMCELGVFPIFLENDLLKVDKILGLTFFKARKDLEGFNTAFFNLL